MSLNDKETLPMRKSTKQKRKQVVDMKTLVKIIPISSTYAFIVEKKSMINKKSINHMETNNKTRTTTFDLNFDTSFFLF
jgi:hypothetical protein